MGRRRWNDLAHGNSAAGLDISASTRTVRLRLDAVKTLRRCSIVSAGAVMT
jgi:hypothetical protein